MPPTTIWTYYKQFWKQLWRECSSWTRDNILLGLILLFGPPLIGILQHRSLSPDWQQVLTTTYIYFAFFILYFLYHMVRTPWKLDLERQKESQELMTDVERKEAEIEALAWSADRPVIRFDKWDSSPESNFANQRGFYLVNNGGPASELIVEDFKVGTNVWSSKVVPGIDPSKEGFALVWHVSGGPFGKFDLLNAMSQQAGPAALYNPDYQILVSALVRDSRDFWYRAKATLTFVRSQGRLQFGPTTMEKVGRRP